MFKYKVGDYVRYKGDISIIRIVEIENDAPKYQIGVLNPNGISKYLYIEWVEESDIQSA